MTTVNPFAAAATQANSSTREPSKYWVNVGALDSQGEFVSFFGTAFDGVKPFKSSNEEHNVIRNSGLSVFQTQFESLKPGETKVINLNGLSIQLRHVGEASTETDKSIVDNFMALFK